MIFYLHPDGRSRPLAHPAQDKTVAPCVRGQQPALRRSYPRRAVQYRRNHESREKRAEALTGQAITDAKRACMPGFSEIASGGGLNLNREKHIADVC